jgi:hypothetical protein
MEKLYVNEIRLDGEVAPSVSLFRAEAGILSRNCRASGKNRLSL